MKTTTWKYGGLVFAIIPIVMLLIAALKAAGGIGQLVPIALLAAYGWYAPRPAGFVLIFGGIALMILYAISAIGSVSGLTIALVELVIFVPLVISGFCFLKSE